MPADTEQIGLRVTVGLEDADVTGNDNRALQSAVYYGAARGGGLVDDGVG